jgi:hypothetical protein
MVKVSTLFHRVDGFDVSDESPAFPVFLDFENEDKFLKDLLEPLRFDPGDKLVQTILKNA